MNAEIYGNARVSGDIWVTDERIDYIKK